MTHMLLWILAILASPAIVTMILGVWCAIVIGGHADEESDADELGWEVAWEIDRERRSGTERKGRAA